MATGGVSPTGDGLTGAAPNTSGTHGPALLTVPSAKAVPDAKQAGPDAAPSTGPDAAPSTGPGGTPSTGPDAGPSENSWAATLLARPAAMVWLLVVGVAALAGHLLAAARVGADIATLGETRLAVAIAAARGGAVVADPIPLSDRFAAVQLAVLQTLLPIGGLPLVDAGRWACLAVGAGAALMVWPIARGLGIPAPAAAVGVALAGVALPALALHSGVSAAVVATLWLSLAAACAVRGWGRAAAVAAGVGILTAPLAAAALLALAAHLVLNGTVRPSVRFRMPIGVMLGVAAVVVALLAVADGPLAGAAGPEVGTPVAVAGAVVGLLLVVIAGQAETWLRPVFAASVLLFVVALLPGPSRAAALVLAVPVLAVAGAVLIEPLGERFGAAVAPLSAVLVGVLIVPLFVPVAAGPPPRPSALLAWIMGESRPDVPVRADALDRAELLAAGFPAQRLRGPDDPGSGGELVLVTDRPTAGLPDRGPARCADDEVVAGAPSSTGGAPALVCRSDGGGATVAAERPARARLGAALADNPSVRLGRAAEAALRDGAVDPRLMLVLAAITSAHAISVDDFPPVVLDAPGVPLRRAVLASVDGTPTATSPLLRTWLDAQQPPYLPSEVRPQGTALLVGYPAPPPGGLLPE